MWEQEALGTMKIINFLTGILTFRTF